MSRLLILLISIGAAIIMAPTVSAQLGNIIAPADPDPQDPTQVVPDDVDNALDRSSGNGLDGPNAPNAPGAGTGMRDISGAVASAVADNLALSGAIATGVLAASATSWILASRYVDPKVALKNPQRSMLYGFIKGNPGVHLKQLSNEFHMKTSTVLWHIRKLEHADLVRSKKANGYRVFYPVSGGMEAKQLSTAVTALSNHNAKSIFEFVAINPGAHRRILSGSLTINPGTVRWHLKKLREAGLVAELAQDRLSTYFATDLGLKAMRQVATLPATVTAPILDISAMVASDPLADDEAEPEPIAAT